MRITRVGALTGLLLAGAAVGLALPGLAIAQASPQATTGANSNSDAIEEIVVTANKRSESINSVGMSVVALTGAALQDRQITSLQDLAQTVPSLSFTTSATNTPVFTLRGVGFYETSLAAYPTVSVYLDEVPLSFPALTKHSGFDLERVEVLKGPQGLLFGQNATGGAINYIAAKPTQQFEAGTDLTIGNYNSFSEEAFVSGPISNTLSARLSERVETSSGWQQSNSRPGDTNGGVRNYMGRLLLDFKPSDGVRLQLNVNGWIDDSEPQAPQLVGKNYQLPLVPADLQNAPFSPLTPRAADWVPDLPFAHNRFAQGALRGDIDLTGTITLTSISSYSAYFQRQGTSGTGLPLLDSDIVQDLGSIHSFSQELRVANAVSERFRWVAGTNYERSTVDELTDIRYDNASSNYTYEQLYGYPIYSNEFTADQKMRNYAFFGNGEYDLLSNLAVKAGARYTDAERDANLCNANPLGTQVKNTGAAIYDLVLGGAQGPYLAGDCFGTNLTLPGLAPATIGGVPPNRAGRFIDTLDESNISWRVGTDYKPNESTLLYVDVSKGWKAGSFPSLSASNISQYLPVRQESVLAYETGFKIAALNRLLQVNGSIFYYDYTDKQLRSKFVDPVFGVLDQLQNIPKSSVKGAELEVTARPVSGLTLSLSATYLDAVIEKFVGTNASGLTTDFAGAAIPYTPKYQAGANADYGFPLAPNLGGFLGGGVTYRSATNATIGGNVNPTNAFGEVPTLFAIDAYALVDVRAGVNSLDGKWRVTLWGKNVLNKYYWDNVVQTYDTIGRYTGMPATYGINLKYRF